MYARPILGRRSSLRLFAKIMLVVASLQVLLVFPNMYFQNSVTDRITTVVSILIATSAMFLVFGSRIEARYWQWRAKRSPWHFQDTKEVLSAEEGSMIVGIKWHELVPEIAAWCRENCKGSYGVIPIMGHDVTEYQKPRVVWFSNGDDAFHFKMRWL